MRSYKAVGSEEKRQQKTPRVLTSMSFSLFLWKNNNNNKHKCSSLSSEEEAGGRGVEQEEEKLLTVNISDLRGRLKEKEGPLKSHLDARLPVQRRALWLPGPAWAHTHRHSQPLPPALCAPSSKQNSLSQFLSQACTELTVIIGRWAAGFWVSIQQGLMKKKTKNWMFCRSQYLAWALRSFSFP